MAKVKGIAKVKSFSELFQKASGGDENYQKLAIAALNNLGCDHLAEKREAVKWKAYYFGLQQYVSALVGEYGMREDKAEKEVLAEVNGVRDCLDGIELNWPEKKPKEELAKLSDKEWVQEALKSPKAEF